MAVKFIGDAAEPLIQSTHGDFGRPNRVTFTVVSETTLYIATDPAVTPDTGVPIVKGVFVSDENLRSGETIYGIAETGEEVEVRYMSFGPKIN